MTPETVQFEETQKIELIEQGVPPSAIDLRGLDREFLLTKARRANLAWVDCYYAGRKTECEDFEKDVEAIYRELGNQRTAQRPIRTEVPRLLGRLLHRDRAAAKV